MATYAAVVSLMNTIDAVMTDPRLSTCFEKQQIQFLGEKLAVLLQFIENYDYNSLGAGNEAAQILERRIASAAHAAEDVIETHIVVQIHAGVLEDAPTSCIDLHQIMHDINQIKEEVVKAEVKTRSTDEKPKNSPPPLPTGKMTMIGFDDYLIQLLDGLTGSESGRLVIPIVGMGGVGKTTLTKNAYENLLTVQHFDVRACVSISQQYDVMNILVQLLSTLGLSTEGKNEGELSECLYKFLFGRRYLVVLDDMWSITAWDKLKSCFPKDSTINSRIVVTTRLLELANAFDFPRVVRVGLLDDNKSWDLFCYKAFAQQCCPDELEQIGKAIVKKYKGLPLSIVVIGALLRKSSQVKEYWENIAENMSSILSSAENNVDCLDILCLSYHHLPAHLKPCFLYLGIFREDDEILMSRLMKLWIAEGLIKPNKDNLLEEVAEGYINDLLERSLILVDSLGWNKKFTSFHVHDLVRDLCLREAQKEKFFSVIKTHGELQGNEMERCLVIPRGCSLPNNGQYIHTSTVTRSLICECDRGQLLLYGSTLLRVLVTSEVNFELARIGNYFQQVNMRFLSFDSDTSHGETLLDEVPRSIFLSWNLQTVMIGKYVKLKWKVPIEIWKLRHLRHVEMFGIALPEPPLSDEEDDQYVLHHMQTLLGVVDLRLNEEVCKRIPNIKRLQLLYSEDFSKNPNDYCLQNVGRFNKLESLSYTFLTKPYRNYLVQNLTLLTSLKELSLWNSQLEWDDMRIIGLLPNLEALKLLEDSFKGTEWTCVEGQFLALKQLEINWCDCTVWNVESCHFPVLDTLVLESVTILEGIPLGIGEIPTLRIVRVDRCNQTLMISTMKILEEQETLGNDALQLQIQFVTEEQVKEFLEEVKNEGIVCTNFSCRSIF